MFDTNTVLDDLRMLSVTPEGEPKLGQSEESGIVYYLWTLTWGLGWVPTVAATIGALALARANWRLALVLAPAPLLFILFMGIQERYFGRYLLPIFPILCMLAAYGTLWISRLLASRVPQMAPVITAAAACALLVQGIVYSVHGELVLTREETRSVAREWMVENIPAGTLIVLEPIMPREWLADPGPELAKPHDPGELASRWETFSVGRALRRLARRGEVSRNDLMDGEIPRRATSATYVRFLHPALIDAFIQAGACWVVAGTSQWGRAFAEPEQVPAAVDFYQALDRRAEVAYMALPYAQRADRTEFNFDWSSNYYPLHYTRPGPEVVIYRLTGGGCGDRR